MSRPVARARRGDAGMTGLAGAGAPASVAGPGDRGPRRLSAGVRSAAPAAAGYLLLAVAADWHVWAGGHAASVTTCACGDPALTLWFLAWLPHAIGHGLFPFHSDLLFANQGGLNLLDNTGHLLVALVLAPITVTFGPVASFNVAVTAGPVVSALCALWAARRFGASPLASAVAGALWGFSPMVLGHAPFGHFQVSWAVGAPLLLGCFHRLLVEQDRPWWRDALSLGLVVVVTFFVSTEQLLLAAVGGACLLAAVVVLAAVAREPLRPRLGHAARACGGAAVGAGLLLAWPLWYALEGPRHITGPPWPGLQLLGERAGATVDSGYRLMSASLASLAGLHGRPGPALGYLGPLLAAGAVGAVALLWRRRLTWGLLVTWAVLWALGLGVSAGGWTPWRLLYRLPLFDEVVPDRFAGLGLLAVALVVALAIDEVGRLAVRAGRFARAVVPGVVVVVLAAFGLQLGAQGLPYPVVPARVPAWFTAEPAPVPEGSVVLVLPYATSGISSAMAWQAIGGMRIRLVGGYAVTPAPGLASGPGVHPPLAGSFDAVLDALTFSLGAPPSDDAATLALLRSGVRRLGVEAAVVAPQPVSGASPSGGPASGGPATAAESFGPVRAAYAAGLFAAVFDRAPVWTGGAWVFTSVGEDGGPAVVPEGTLASCLLEAGAFGSGGAGPAAAGAAGGGAAGGSAAGGASAGGAGGVGRLAGVPGCELAHRLG